MSIAPASVPADAPALGEGLPTPPASSLGHVPSTEKWQFDDQVANCFDDMLARSIPQYDVMRRTCFEVGKAFVRPGSHVLDLGCSRGEALAPFVAEFDDDCDFIGVELSIPMRDAARTRFAANPKVAIHGLDLRHDYPIPAVGDASQFASLTLCILTLQFTPIEYRQRIVRNICEHTLPGGALLIVEKVIGSTADIDELQTQVYYDLKKANGYSQEEIDRKRCSLEGVLVPVTAKWNEELLHTAGFQHVECFWRWLNFAGWIAVK